MSGADRFSAATTISLETYKKSGAAVKTPVWLVVDGGTLYVRTDPTSGKAKRIRNNPRVRLAPSDFRGNVQGEWAEAEARFVDGPEVDRILKAFMKKYGLRASAIGLWHRIRGAPRYVVLAITVAPA